MQENYQKQHSDESDKKEKGRRLDLLVDGKESYVFEVFFFFFTFFIWKYYFSIHISREKFSQISHFS